MMIMIMMNYNKIHLKVKIGPTYHRHVELLSEGGKHYSNREQLFKQCTVGQKKTGCLTRELAVLY